MKRRSFLHATAAATAATVLPGTTRSAEGDTPCRVILVNAGGGWDISYALDPKPGLSTVDSPVGEIVDFDGLPIFAHETRPNVTSFFESFASRSCLLHGIGMRSISHITCGQKIYTGRSSANAPDAAAIVGHELGRELPLPYLVLGGVAFSGSLGVSTGRVGSINQINALLPPGDFFPDAPGFEHERYEATSSEEGLIQQFLDRRAEREAATRGATGYNARRVSDFRVSLLKSDAIRNQSGAFGEFAFAFTLQDQADFAVRALSEDLSWTIGLDSRLDWDTHGYNDIQGPLHEELFAGLSYLAERLESTPGSAGNTLLDETLVVVMSEMSRTPLLNASGGKDHWPTTSMLMFGGPARGGHVIGASNDLVESELIDIDSGELDPNGVLLEPRHILSGIVDASGADATDYSTTEPFRAPFI